MDVHNIVCEINRSRNVPTANLTFRSSNNALDLFVFIMLLFAYTHTHMQSDTATKKRLLFYCIKIFHPSIRVRRLRLSFLIIEIPPSPHTVLYNCEHPSFAVRPLADSLRIWRVARTEIVNGKEWVKESDREKVKGKRTSGKIKWDRTEFPHIFRVLFGCCSIRHIVSPS